MNRLMMYLHGLWMALCGRYPHDELIHLEFIKIHIREDARWLSIHPSISLLSDRHEKMCDSQQWRHYSAEHVGNFRKRLFTAVRDEPVCQHVHYSQL